MQPPERRMNEESRNPGRPFIFRHSTCTAQSVYSRVIVLPYSCVLDSRGDLHIPSWTACPSERAGLYSVNRDKPDEGQAVKVKVHL